MKNPKQEALKQALEELYNAIEHEEET